MTPEREAVAKILEEVFRTNLSHIWRCADRIIAEHIAPLRVALATAEREIEQWKAGAANLKQWGDAADCPACPPPPRTITTNTTGTPPDPNSPAARALVKEGETR